jgi:hypothetical protein
VPDDRSLREVVLEYAVYVPIGIAVSVAEQLPELTEKGRRLASTRLQVARLMGEFAVGHAQRRFGRALSPDNRAAGHAPGDPGEASGPPSRHGPESVAVTEATSPGPSSEVISPDHTAEEEVTAQAPPGTTAGSVPRQARRPRRPSPDMRDSTSAVTPPAVGAVPVVESLAIPGYDTLAASQVVQRLSSLEPDELEAVRRYELGTRGRRTILHRVAQLNPNAGRT